MYLIEVIPISRGGGKETLSYFSSEKIANGSLVLVPIRKKIVHALVVSSTDAREAKTEIRSSSYSMKKVDEFGSERFLSESFMKSARFTADFFSAPLGSVINALVPKAILLGNISAGSQKSKPKESAGFDRVAIQADDEERFADYRSIIREEFARKRSVFFCVPTAMLARQASAILPKGIEGYVYVLCGSLPKKKLQTLWKTACSESHPVLIIATGQFLSMWREDFGTIIVENESSRAYKLPTRPYLDIRTFAETYAKENSAKFIVGDTLLRTETIFRCKLGEFSELSPLKFRSLSPADFKIVDMKNSRKNAGGKGKFEAVSQELYSLIEKSHTANQNLFIFAVRRGLSPQTICGDCGTVTLCSRCRSPITLHRARLGDGNKNFFFCHSCGEKRSAEERCLNCQSWKLVPLGVGAELLEQEITQKFPSVKIFRIDKDNTKTAKRAEKEAVAFLSSPGTILIGTEMALPYLNAKIDNVAIASLDSLFSLPDFRVHERIIHLILKMRAIAENMLLVQTRVPEEHILEYALKGNLIDFYREEISARETFRYPPFTTLIKITLAGTRTAVLREIEKLKTHLAPVALEIFPAFAEESRGVFQMHALIRISRGAWPNSDLLQKLLALPPQFKIVVEPESLL